MNIKRTKERGLKEQSIATVALDSKVILQIKKSRDAALRAITARAARGHQRVYVHEKAHDLLLGRHILKVEKRGLVERGQSTKCVGICMYHTRHTGTRI